MFCRNCGNPVQEGAAVCLHCGVRAGTGVGFCQNCGSSCNENAAVCLRCGAALSNVPAGAVQKSRLTAGLLGILLGGFGVHNFYLGYTTRGILQILLSFCFGIGYIWGLVEGILILCGKINEDADGIPLAD